MNILGVIGGFFLIFIGVFSFVAARKKYDLLYRKTNVRFFGIPFYAQQDLFHLVFDDEKSAEKALTIYYNFLGIIFIFGGVIITVENFSS